MTNSITTNRAITEKVNNATDFHIGINVVVDYTKDKPESGWMLEDALVRLIREELDNAVLEVKNRFHELNPGKSVTVIES